MAFVMKIKNNPKRHHYLPKFYLNNFCRSRFLWVFDRQKNEYRQQTPVNTAVKRRYYAITDSKGIHHNDIENVLSKIEGESKNILEKVEQYCLITLEEKTILSVFVALLYTRVPGFEQLVDDQTEKIIKHLGKFSVPNIEIAKEVIKKFAKKDEQEKISPKELLAFVQNENYDVKFSRSHSLRIMYTLTRQLPLYLVQMDWQFWHVPQKGSFVTSDNPFILTPPEKYRGPFGLITKGAKKVCPLSQNVCLVMCDYGERIIHMNITRKQARCINSLIAMHSDRFLFGKDKILLESLVKLTKINKWRKNKKR